MGVEVMGFEPAPAPGQKENGKLNSAPVISQPIKFGTHGDVVERKEAKIDVAESDVPKNAVEDWPEPKQIHNFYFMKYRAYTDQNLKDKIALAEKEFDSKRDARFPIIEELKVKKADRTRVISQLKVLNEEHSKMWGDIDKKLSVIKPLNDVLGKLRGSNGGKSNLCSSEEELDSLIRHKNYLIQHESNTLAEERELMNEIKQLEQSRKKVIAHAVNQKEIQEEHGKKESIQDQVKVMGDDLDKIKKNRDEVKGKKMKLQDELSVIDKGIEPVNKKLDDITEKKDKAYENLQKLRKQKDEGNAYFYHNCNLLNKARILASQKDVNALKELVETEVENFMHLWSSNKAFRDDYQKKNLRSLDSRLLSRDGRMRNPDEKPILEPTPPAETASAGSKTNAKASKEDSKPGLKNGSLTTTGKSKEEALKKPEESVKISKESPITLEEEEDFFVPVKVVSTTKEEIDETTLKKLKIQEQKEKHEQALKRKNKLAERKQRAVILSEQGAFEKKLTKSEKKAKKKGTTSEPDVDSKESTEPDSEVIEPLETVQAREVPVPSKKINPVRNRNLSKGPKPLPKAILRRRKTTKYWMWGATAGIVGLILLALVYHFLL